MNDNLDCLRLRDDAYNARDWDAYSLLLSEEFRGSMQGQRNTHGKVERLRRVKELCAISVDNRVHNAPYIVGFEEGTWTCTVARLVGSLVGPLRNDAGVNIKPVPEGFETVVAAMTRWADGKIVEEHQFFDASLMMRLAWDAA